jgi:glycerol uptake facilitator protein
VIGVLVYDLFIGDVLHIRAQQAAEPEVGRTRLVTGADEE